ncbi:hypothetical protein OSTOST_14768, partial [Ostertagia ostertagi]
MMVARWHFIGGDDESSVLNHGIARLIVDGASASTSLRRPVERTLLMSIDRQTRPSAVEYSAVVTTAIHNKFTKIYEFILNADSAPQSRQKAAERLQDLVVGKVRGPDELLSSIHGTFLAPVMTVDSEPKKAKLDPTALYSQYISQMNGLTTAQLLAGQPLAQIAAPTHCSASSSTPRSRVVHIRNIPPDMVDVELIQLCVPYGPLSNYMMLKGKSQ